MHVLGINAYHGDASAALFSDGQLVIAVEEERLNRIKHWAGMPLESVRVCLDGLDPRQIQHVGISRDPKAHFSKKLLRVATTPQLWRQIRGRAANSIKVTQFADDLAPSGIAFGAGTKFHKVEHHRSHMASAFFASPFEEAAIVSVDGFGDFSKA